MFKTSVLALVLAFAFSAFAQEQQSSEGQTTIKIEDAKDQKNKVSGEEDMDEVITNRKMRAEAGSKSKHSLNTSISYSGGTIEKPLAEERPNLTAGTGVTAFASLGGSMAYKYSLTAKDAFRLGTGVRWITPLQGTELPTNKRTGKKFNGAKVDAENPYITYQRVHKLGPVQGVFVTGPTLYTNENLRRLGFHSYWSFQQNMNYEIAKSGFSVGLLLGGSISNYDKNDQVLQNEYQSDYYVGAYPYLEYVINDTFNLRTISGVWVYEHMRGEKQFWKFNKNIIYQSVGLGISVTRDIFLYPNIQFLPENIRADQTNVALSTNINVF